MLHILLMYCYLSNGVCGGNKLTNNTFTHLRHSYSCICQSRIFLSFFLLFSEISSLTMKILVRFFYFELIVSFLIGKICKLYALSPQTFDSSYSKGITIHQQVFEKLSNETSPIYLSKRSIGLSSESNAANEKSNCHIRPIIHLLKYPGCVPKSIPSFACQGRCSSYVQVRSTS